MQRQLTFPLGAWISFLVLLVLSLGTQAADKADPTGTCTWNFTTKYDGKVTGDTIKGKMEFERDGETRSRDWEAKIKGSKTAGDLTDNWQYSFTTSGGQTFEPTLKLKQDGDKVSGVLVFGENE